MEAEVDTMNAMPHTILLATLCAGCTEPPELGEASPAIVRDYACLSTEVKLYTGIDYLGSVICLQGVGYYRLPAPFSGHVESMTTGDWTGHLMLDSVTPTMSFWRDQSYSNVPAQFSGARAVQIEYGPDAGGT